MRCYASGYTLLLGIDKQWQKAFTAQMEAWHRRLAERINRLPQRDPIRVAYGQSNRFSTSWVTRHPSSQMHIPGVKFSDTFAIYLGFPTVLVGTRVGSRLPCARNGERVLGAHGFELGTAFNRTGNYWIQRR